MPLLLDEWAESGFDFALNHDAVVGDRQVQDHRALEGGLPDVVQKKEAYLATQIRLTVYRFSRSCLSPVNTYAR